MVRTPASDTGLVDSLPSGTVTPARAVRIKNRLKITETFLSIQGEGLHAGLPCTFIRLTGCALRCTYCDTAYAFHGGSWRGFEDLYSTVEEAGARLVQITGGEPLHQKAVWPFVEGLVERGFKPLIETGGMEDIAGLHPQAHIVLDIKTPGSGELERMRWENLDLLRPSDEVKFVVCHLEDLEWALDLIGERNLDQHHHVLISPVAEFADKAAMAERVIASKRTVRFQVQLHKVLWGDEPGR